MMKNENGFLLLEIIVALVILSLGFLTVVQLYSGGLLLGSRSDQYLKGIALANHKFSELEIENFDTETFEAIFANEPGYRWQLDIQPYNANLHIAESNIQISQVTLNVFWTDSGQEKNIQLTSLKILGTTHPAEDTVLSGPAGRSTRSSGSTSAFQDSLITSSPSRLSASRALRFQNKLPGIQP